MTGYVQALHLVAKAFYSRLMADNSIVMILAVTATFLGAGMVKGITGMGLPTVAMGVLGALLSPLMAASLLIVPSFVTNVWQLLAGPHVGTVLRRLWPMMLAVAGFTVAGTYFLANADTGLTTALLGCALIVYALYALLARPVRVPSRIEPWLSPIVGAVTGMVAGVTGVFVMPAVPYLQALGLEKDDLVQALGLSFTVSTMSLALGLALQGAYRIDNAAISALAVVPALVGMWLGQILRNRISPATFRRWFLIGLLLLGAEMVSRAFY